MLYDVTNNYYMHVNICRNETFSMILLVAVYILINELLQDGHRYCALQQNSIMKLLQVKLVT